VGVGVTLVGASLYFSSDRLPHVSSVLLRDNALYAGHAVPSSPVVVDDLPLILVDRYAAAAAAAAEIRQVRR